MTRRPALVDMSTARRLVRQLGTPMSFAQDLPMLHSDLAHEPFGPLCSVPPGPICGGADALLLSLLTQQHTLPEDAPFLHFQGGVAFARISLCHLLGMTATEIKRPGNPSFWIFQDAQHRCVGALAQANGHDAFYPEPFCLARSNPIISPDNAPALLPHLQALWNTRAHGPAVCLRDHPDEVPCHGPVPTWHPHRRLSAASHIAIIKLLVLARDRMRAEPAPLYRQWRNQEGYIRAVLSTPARGPEGHPSPSTAHVEVRFHAPPPGDSCELLWDNHTSPFCAATTQAINALPSLCRPHALGFDDKCYAAQPFSPATPLFFKAAIDIDWNARPTKTGHQILDIHRQWNATHTKGIPHG